MALFKKGMKGKDKVDGAPSGKDGGPKGAALQKKAPVAPEHSRIGEFVAEMRPRLKELKGSLVQVLHNPSVMLGIFFILAIVAVALLAPWIAPPDPLSKDPMRIPRDYILPPRPPGTDGLIFGSGDMGLDVFYGVVWGARTTIYTSLLVVSIATIIGLMLGAIAGFYGGKIDNLVMRITDMFLSLPALILAMAVSSILAKNLDSIIFALIIVWWPAYARLVRGQVLAIKENTYVEAAKAIGAKRQRILFKHVIPNSLTPLIVAVTMDIGSVALTAAGLSYIGFGVDTGYAEWGRMVSDGQQWFVAGYWWTVVFPGMSILLFTMGFSLVGDGLRDILDPRMKR
ncbi:MAG: D-ala-D-ala transporter subunit [Methanomassiliicoccales archaeon PtaB.Bin134]|mgnify:FL=1|nr:MAG: D-ala-D-ala transporter subunit [Methanomassiliicoccales archaeon PtaB.Bin134]